MIWIFILILAVLIIYNFYEVDEILFDYLNGVTENELVEKYSAPIVNNIVSRYKHNFKLNLPITIKRTEIC